MPGDQIWTFMPDTNNEGLRYVNSLESAINYKFFESTI